MKNKGFTLVEVLAVLSLIAVLFIILVPIITNSYITAKNKIKDYDKQALYDGVKTYLTNLQENGYNLVTTNNYDNDCRLIGTNSEYKKTSYKVNDIEYSGYDFTTYAAQNDIYVTAEYLVKNGYYNNGCNYDATESSCEKSGECKISKECTLVIHYDSERIKANPDCNLGDDCTYYYQLGNYSINILDESKCVIK